jgi:hypothetical protein
MAGLLLFLLILRSGAFAASRRMKASVGASWFGTALTRLLTMRLLDTGVLGMVC